MQIRLAGNGTTWGQPRFMSPDELDGWRGYVDEVAAAGFDGLEHLPPMAPIIDATLLGQELQQRDLALAGIGLYGALETPDGRESLEDQIDVAATFVAEVGADYLFIIDEMYANPFTGELERPVELDDPGWAKMIENLHELNDRAQNRCGLPLLLHPHQYSHIDTTEQIERFLAGTDPDHISILFDTGHYTCRGGDAVAFYRQHHERIGHLHFKNVVRSQLPDHEVTQRQLVETGAFANLSSGDVDFEALYEALDAFGYDGWGTVENERLPDMPGTPIDLARNAVQHLRALERAAADPDLRRSVEA